MEMALQKALEKSWAATCKVLLGREIGQLHKYREWLSTYMPHYAKRKSHRSGQEVILAMDAYSPKAKFIAESEVDQNRDYGLSVNDIKDIESIIGAISERSEYVGNRFLGNSAHVDSSDIVIDSQYVNNSANIEESQYVDSSFMIRRGSKHIFGSAYMGESEFITRVYGTFNSKRCFESYFIPDSSDTYFSESCFGCHETMFSFGLRGASYRIGNLALPKDKYLQLKAKLISEVASELEKDGTFPSLLEIAGESPSSAKDLEVGNEKKEGSMAPIEKGFASTYGIIFKKSPSSIAKYENWLSKSIPALVPVQSPFGRKIYCPENFAYFGAVPKGRLVNFDEMMAIGKTCLARQEVEALPSIMKGIGKIGYFTPELYEGENFNCVASPLVYHGTNAYKTYDLTHGDNSGVCFLPLNSKYTYGCYRILESQFSMKCYNSLYLNRCLELDSCNKCADSYFCHNSEALQDCMFCFNMKGRRHSIGNTQLGKDAYAKAKTALVGQMADELERKNSLRWDIFSIGAKR